MKCTNGYCDKEVPEYGGVMIGVDGEVQKTDDWNAIVMEI